jgi:NAD(P)H-dependent FMN reductase
MPHLLAISGSLRAGSSNGAIVEAATQLASLDVVIFDGLASLPPFNPDDEAVETPVAVAAWRRALTDCSGVLLSSPEYAHGVPGVLKNALDWVVGSGEFMHLPVALVNASAFSSFVTEQLRETLTVMMADVVVATSLSLRGRPSNAADILMQPQAAAELREALLTLTDAVSRVAERAS